MSSATRSALICAAAVAPAAAAAPTWAIRSVTLPATHTPGTVGPAGRVGRDVLADPGRVLDRRAARAPARKPARATIRGATTTASRRDHACRRAAARPSSRSSATSRAATSPSTTRDAAGGELLGLLRRSAAAWCGRRSVTSALHCRNSSAWCTDIGPLAEHADRPGRGPPSRGSTGSAARRGPTARAGPARPAARRPARWSPAAGAPATVRPSASVTANPSPSRVGRGDLAVHDLRRRSRRTSARPRASSSAGRRCPSRPSSPCTPVGRRVARRARVDHQHRAPRPGQHQRPAQPGGAAADHHDVVRCPSSSVIATTSTTTMRRLGRDLANLRCRSGKLAGMDDDLDQALAAVGPRLRALRQQRETTLAELSAQTGISVSTLSRLESGAAPADPRAAAAAGPGPRRHRSTSWSAPRRPATRASTCARSPGTA